MIQPQRTPHGQRCRSRTVPDLITGMGVRDPVTIGDQEFDSLFVVLRGAGLALLHLRY